MSFTEDTTPCNTSAVFNAALVPTLISCTEPSISSLVLTADFALCSARLRIWSATTANPRPCSPARAASIAAFRDKRFVSSAIPLLSIFAIIYCASTVIFEKDFSQGIFQ